MKTVNSQLSQWYHALHSVTNVESALSSSPGAMAGGFNFQVNDGMNFAPRQIFSVTARTLVLHMERSGPLKVFPGKHTCIFKRYLPPCFPNLFLCLMSLTINTLSNSLIASNLCSKALSWIFSWHNTSTRYV